MPTTGTVPFQKGYFGNL